MDLLINQAAVQTLDRPCSWQLKFGDSESRPFFVHIAALRKDYPNVDANLDEWASVPMLEIGKEEQITRGREGWTPQDASAKVGFWFSPDTLYVGAHVTDDDPIVNDNPPNLIWKGDALELYLGFDGPTRRTVLNKECEFQLGIAPTCSEKRPLVFLFHEDRILGSVIVAAQPVENGYVLEAAIALKELKKAAERLRDGMFLGLDVALDDLDGGDWAPEANTPGRALMWNGGPMNWIDPSGWGLAVVGANM